MHHHHRHQIIIIIITIIIKNVPMFVTDLSQKASTLLGLVPAVICEQPNIDVNEAVEVYRHFLPSPELLPLEIRRWRMRYQQKKPTDRPESCATAIKEIDDRDFPNLAVLLKIACTLPVTSCECERSASVLRRLHSWCRTSMGQDRLASLALMHVHYDETVDLNQVVDIFARKHQRRMQLDHLLIS